MLRTRSRRSLVVALLAMSLGLAASVPAAAERSRGKDAEAKGAGPASKGTDAADPVVAPAVSDGAAPSDAGAAAGPGSKGIQSLGAGEQRIQSLGAGEQRIQSLGAGEQRLWLVDHGDTWSLHVESVRTDTLFQLWRTAGGPRVASKVSLDRPWTTAVHRVKAERIIERMLDGFSYTLHYDGRGRLDAVHVYSLDSQQMYKTPRLTESRVKWSETETADLAESAAAASPTTTLPVEPE